MSTERCKHIYKYLHIQRQKQQLCTPRMCVLRVSTSCCFLQNASLRGRRLKGKGKGVLGKEVLGAKETPATQASKTPT